MKVYFISGLAADGRVFRHIILPENYVPMLLEWIPALKHESLRDYALRLAEGISKNEPFGIIGLSMGGMIATEIARQYKPSFLVLISSIPYSNQLPFYIKAAGLLKVHKMIPVSLVKSAAIIKRLFTKESDEDKTMLRAIIKDSDNDFIHWAMDAILKWRSEEVFPLPYIHIHGTKDEVLPIRFTKPTHVIKRGSHLMVMNRAEEINAILRSVLMSN